jgi:hypothetical protein
LGNSWQTLGVISLKSLRFLFRQFTLLLLLLALSCSPKSALLVLDPYVVEWQPNIEEIGLQAGAGQGFSVTSLTLSNMTDWDKELEQFEGKAADLIVLSGIYSGTFLEKLQEYYPEATVVLFAAGEISAQGSVGVVNIDRSPAMVEMGRFSAQIHEVLDQEEWEAPALLVYTRPSQRQEEKRALVDSWDSLKPRLELYIQEFFRLRDFVDLTRMIKDILAQTRRPWVSLLTSVMTKDALDQLPPETLVMGEGLKVYLGESPRLLASVEFDYQSLLQKAFEIGKEETPGFHEVPAILWKNPDYRQTLRNLLTAQEREALEREAQAAAQNEEQGGSPETIEAPEPEDLPPGDDL